MNTADRASHLAIAAQRFPFLGQTSAEDLRVLVRTELGHERVLDDFVSLGAIGTKAFAPRTILHILSGNTPAAALQSLIRGLLIGSHNRCKIPSMGLPEVAQFQAALPPELAARIEVSRDLPDAWLREADTFIVFGGDETIAHFRARATPRQTFIAHGHALSFGVVFADADFASVAGAARDVSVFDQQGCLSPHVIYVRGDARSYADRLADEMQRFDAREPRGAISLSESNMIRALRDDLAFRAANDESIALHASQGSTAWTVAYIEKPGFPHSPLNRCVFVKPLPANFVAELSEVRDHLSCAGIWPPTLENARSLAGVGVSRICPLGEMQTPPWSWRQDGQLTLAPLIRWVTAETLEEGTPQSRIAVTLGESPND